MKHSRPGQGIGDKETREAYRRLGIHSRLGKVWRLGPGRHEPCMQGDDQVGIATYIWNHRSIVLSIFSELF